MRMGGAFLFWLIPALAAAAELPPAQAREAWREVLQWSPETCPPASPDPEQSGVVEIAPPAGRYIQVLCERWAYQGTSLIYRRSADGWVSLEFPQYESVLPGKRSRYVSPLLTGLLLGVGADGRSLRVLRAYRGGGDCGQYLVYRPRGTRAELVTLRVRECPALPDARVPPPERWPLTRK